MASQELVGISWNIGAAQVADYTSEARDGWAHHGEDIDHVIGTLQELSPDFVAIQESHTRDDFITSTGPRRVMAEEIATALDMHYRDNPVSPSHVDGMAENDPGKYWLSLAILSKLPIVASSYIPFPQPDFPIYLPGRSEPIPEDKRHEKAMQIATLENGLHVVTSQTLPANFLGFNYAAGEGVSLTTAINERLTTKLPTKGEIFFAGDLNYDERFGNPAITEVFTAFAHRNMQSVFPEEEPALSVRKGRKEEAQGSVKTDYVLLSNGLTKKNAEVIRSTSSGRIKPDHYPLRVAFHFASDAA